MTLALAGAIVALVVAILVPSIPKRTPEYRIRCASNMRAIGKAIFAYADLHGGAFPDSLGSLVLEADPNLEVSAACFVCPASNDKPAKHDSRDSLAHQLSTIGAPDSYALAESRLAAHNSYIYAATGRRRAGILPETVLLYEPLSNHAKGAEGINVLLGDGTVDFIPTLYASKYVAELLAGHNPPRAEKIGDARPTTATAQ